jgi:hypothetical protein
VLKCAASYDMGLTWADLATVDAGPLDWSASGRAGVAWLGETLVCVYGSGTSLLSRKSTDGGHTWGSSVSVATVGSGNFAGITVAADHGTVYALAYGASTALYRSGDLGATWATVGSSPPSVSGGGIALGVIRETGRLLAGVAEKADDDGATWAAP